MALQKVRLNGKGVRAILVSDGVRQHLTQRALNGKPAGHQIIQDTSPGGGRVPPRVAVRVADTDGKGLKRESQGGYLSRALDRMMGGGG